MERNLANKRSGWRVAALATVLSPWLFVPAALMGGVYKTYLNPAGCVTCTPTFVWAVWVSMIAGLAPVLRLRNTRRLPRFITWAIAVAIGATVYLLIPLKPLAIIAGPFSSLLFSMRKSKTLGFSDQYAKGIPAADPEPFATKLVSGLQTLLGLAILLLIFGVFFFFVGTAYDGLEDSFGRGWAIAGIVCLFVFRIGLPIVIGVYLAATNLWGWEWYWAVLLAMPGLILAVPALVVIFLGFVGSLIPRRT